MSAGQIAALHRAMLARQGATQERRAEEDSPYPAGRRVSPDPLKPAGRVGGRHQYEYESDGYQTSAQIK